MKGVNISKTISLSSSAEDWELYASLPLAEEAAMAINQAIEEAVNSGLSAREVREKSMEVMKRFADYGALDSEPLWHLDNLIRRIFGVRRITHV